MIFIIIMIITFIFIIYVALHPSKIIYDSHSTQNYNNTYSTNNSFNNLYNCPAVSEHFKNLTKINSTYSELYNLGDFSSIRMDALIDLCKRDISLAEEFISAFRSNHQEVPPTYGTFKRLAIIYEKRKEYENAIKVCQKAIDLGFTDKDAMYGRLARLQKKNNA